MISLSEESESTRGSESSEESLKGKRKGREVSPRAASRVVGQSPKGESLAVDLAQVVFDLRR